MRKVLAQAWLVLALVSAWSCTRLTTGEGSAGVESLQLGPPTFVPPPPGPSTLSNDWVPVIQPFAASAYWITPGASSTLSWTAANASSVTISGVSPAALPASGQVTVSPTSTTTYTLTAVNPAGVSVNQSLVVTVAAEQSMPPLPQITSFGQASGNSNAPGVPVTLSWTTTDAVSVSISGVTPNALPANGSVTVAPAATTTYTLTATNGAGGTATEAVTLDVVPAPTSATPTVSLFFSPNPINSGESTQLTWYTQYATAVSISPGIGAVAASSPSITVSPKTTTTYTITATGPWGTTIQSSTLVVYPPASAQICGGATWNLVASVAATSTPSQIVGLTTDSTGRVYANGADGLGTGGMTSVIRSVAPGGAVWTTVDSLPDPDSYVAQYGGLLTDSLNNVYAPAAPLTVWQIRKSSNQGGSWTVIDTGGPLAAGNAYSYLYSLNMDRNENLFAFGTIANAVVGDISVLIRESTDHGTTWTNSLIVPQATPVQQGTSGNTDETLYVDANNNVYVIYQTLVVSGQAANPGNLVIQELANGASNWTTIYNQPYASLLFNSIFFTGAAAFANGVLSLSGLTGDAQGQEQPFIWNESGQGTDWQFVANVPSNLGPQGFGQFLGTGPSSAVALATMSQTYASVIYQTASSGQTWAQTYLSDQFLTSEDASLSVMAHGPRNTIAVASSGEVGFPPPIFTLVSGDGGATWQNVPPGSGLAPFQPVATADASGNFYYASANTAGVWQLYKLSCP